MGLRNESEVGAKSHRGCGAGRLAKELDGKGEAKVIVRFIDS